MSEWGTCSSDMSAWGTVSEKMSERERGRMGGGKRRREMRYYLENLEHHVLELVIKTGGGGGGEDHRREKCGRREKYQQGHLVACHSRTHLHPLLCLAWLGGGTHPG